MIDLPSPTLEPAQKPFGWWWALILIGLSLVPAIWAADAPFVGDEPLLIGKAVQANAVGVWDSAGLTGTVARPYGPLPTWIYQLGLMITTDAVELVRLRAVVVTALTLGGAAWIAWLAGFGRAWVLMIAASPYLLLYARSLWDNSFNIPLAAIAAALTLHSVLRRTLWPMPALVAVLGAMLVVHPMALPLVVGVGVVLALWGRPVIAAATTQAKAIVALTTAAVLLFGWIATGPYREVLFAADASAAKVSSSTAGWWFAVWSPRLLSAVGVDYFFPTGYLTATPAHWALAIAQGISAAVFALAWAGGGFTIFGLLKDRNAVAIAGALGLATLAAQILLNGLTHTFGHPHYYNAVWIAPALLVGVSLVWLGRWRRVAPAFVAWPIALSLGLSSLLIFTRLHQTGGTRFEPDNRIRGYGPTIGNQLEVIRRIKEFDPRSPIGITATAFPHALTTLSELDTARPAGPLNPPATLDIRYKRPDDVNDGRIEVIAQPIVAP